MTLYFTLGGVARSGVDYLPLTNSISFADGQASIFLPVRAIDDTLVEGERPLVVLHFHF